MTELKPLGGVISFDEKKRLLSQSVPIIGNIVVRSSRSQPGNLRRSANKADSALLSVSSQLLLAPILRLQDPHIGVRWQGTSGSGRFVADLGAMTRSTRCV